MGICASGPKLQHPLKPLEFTLDNREFELLLQTKTNNIQEVQLLMKLFQNPPAVTADLREFVFPIKNKHAAKVSALLSPRIRILSEGPENYKCHICMQSMICLHVKKNPIFTHKETSQCKGFQYCEHASISSTLATYLLYDYLRMSKTTEEWAKVPQILDTSGNVVVAPNMERSEACTVQIRSGEVVVTAFEDVQIFKIIRPLQLCSFDKIQDDVPTTRRKIDMRAVFF